MICVIQKKNYNNMKRIILLVEVDEEVYLNQKEFQFLKNAYFRLIQLKIIIFKLWLIKNHL